MAGRRRTDSLWFRVVGVLVTCLLTVVTALLGLVVKFYGNLPEDVRLIREGMVAANGRLGRLEERQLELIDANRVSQDWRTRQVVVEKRVDGLEKRVDKLEEPMSIFGPSKKK